MRLIDVDALYAKVQEGEELARKRVLDTETTLPCPTNLNPAYTRYLAQMDERTKLKHMIADAPTIEERKTGKWIRHYSRPNVYADLCWHCSCCGYKTLDNWANKWNFCPNRGCKMEVEHEKDTDTI